MALSKSKKTTIIAIVCGILCAICVFAYTQTVRSSAEAARSEALAKYGGEQIEVCVAKRDIAAGETVDSTCIEQKLWVADLLPDDAIRSSSDILGKQATSSILNGEVISNKRFLDVSVSLEVPAGLSAVSVSAKDVSALGGALKAGMKIDVYATGNTSTSLIAQNVLVLATNASTSQNSSSSSVVWVTLAVEPNLVQELVAASQKATLYFVLPSESSDNKGDSKNSINNLDSSKTSNSYKDSLKEGKSDKDNNNDSLAGASSN